ncbi:MAG: ABC transporter substrate-binding protein [Solobacterium sp.]|nr:ABC transporter substrate-binding protein [Solobacterium sp.]MBR3346533.1 ABC transporter substrate-binding protein [Solobacterium sp.]
MKKVTKMLLSALLCSSLIACGSSNADSGSTATAEPTKTATAEAADGKVYNVGIVQLVQHVALDASAQGFQDALKEALGEDKVNFNYQNAAGDSATCNTIVSSFVTEQDDLILAIATPALQAAANGTDVIPVLGTAITEYGTALSIDNFNGTVGTNVSGTSDLAPLDQQAAMFDELVPDAKTIGIFYCSNEANSKYQAEVVQEALEKSGKTVVVKTFSDSNDVQSAITSLVAEVDAVYIPTDNTAASNTGLIDPVCSDAKIPVICGEEGIMSGCGIATLSIDYYELGKTTGAMAAKILKGESNVSEMPIEYYQNPVKKYDAARCEALGITVPSDYIAAERAE